MNGVCVCMLTQHRSIRMMSAPGAARVAAVRRCVRTTLEGHSAAGLNSAPLDARPEFLNPVTHAVGKVASSFGGALLSGTRASEEGGKWRHTWNKIAVAIARQGAAGDIEHPLRERHAPARAAPAEVPAAGRREPRAAPELALVPFAHRGQPREGGCCARAPGRGGGLARGAGARRAGGGAREGRGGGAGGEREHCFRGV
jgi:hypothetical protein